MRCINKGNERGNHMGKSGVGVTSGFSGVDSPKFKLEKGGQ